MPYIQTVGSFQNSIDEIKRMIDIGCDNRVRARAIEKGLSPNLINELYIRMIDAMVDSEVAEFKDAKNH